MLPIGGNSGGGNATEYKLIAFALTIIVFTPIMFTLFVPQIDDRDVAWEDEIKSIEQQYYNQTGISSSSEKNIWTLTGIYTPYEGNTFGYTDDGWIYGTRVLTDSPSQYRNTTQFPGNLSVAQADNGLWYYTSVPNNMTGITLATYEGNKLKTEGATVYSSVSFNEDFKSDVFFTTSSRGEQEGHYYYQFTGHRYVFQPLSDYKTLAGGNTVQVKSSSTSLSLIWYQYATLSGIAGQLAISGSDYGVSYLTSSDIVRAFNSSNYTSTFDMTFNSVQMHLSVRLDPSRLSAGLSIAECYDGGFWSVMVYSDAVAESMSSPSYEFSASNILDTLISLFTFKIADEYDIDGWLGLFASMMVTAPLYIALLYVCINHPELWALVLILAAIQTLVSVVDKVGDWWPF